MSRNYLEDKAVKKKSAIKALWIVIVILVMAISVVVKITTASSKAEYVKDMPGSDDAYYIAKKFIIPTLGTASGNFADGKYQLAKPSDSVYVIRSSVITKSAGGADINTQFKITLKYNGGQAAMQKNWSMLDLSEN